jgi:hypothetical protein
VGTLLTGAGANTMALDLKTHHLYLPAGDFGPRPAMSLNSPSPEVSILGDMIRVPEFVP